MTLLKFLPLLLVLVAPFASDVRGDGCQNGCCEPDGCARRGVCIRGECGKVCRATVEPVTEEESCWVVECEEICVPRVVCPWSEGGSGLTLFNCFKNKSSNHCGEACSCGSECSGSCGCCRIAPRYGDVRCVRVLNSHDYEVTKYKCNWDLNGSSGSCNCRSCVDAHASSLDLNQVKQTALEVPTQHGTDVASESESPKRPFWKLW